MYMVCSITALFIKLYNLDARDASVAAVYKALHEELPSWHSSATEDFVWFRLYPEF